VGGACEKDRREMKYRILMGKPEVKKCLEEIGVNGGIILKYSLKK
jgi:hypothetical protein